MNAMAKKILAGIAVTVSSVAIISGATILKNVVSAQELILKRLADLEHRVTVHDAELKDRVTYKDFLREMESHQKWSQQVLDQMNERNDMAKQRFDRLESKVDELLRRPGRPPPQ